jgi:hypothetical protein
MFSSDRPTSRAWPSSLRGLQPRSKISSLSPHVNEPSYRPTVGIALILSSDVLGAALLGAAVEMTGLVIGFAAKGESSSQALRRMRPALLLIDAGDAESCVDDVLGPAMMVGARSILFGSSATIALRQALVSQYRLDVLVMPDDVHRIADVVGGRGRVRAR